MTDYTYSRHDFGLVHNRVIEVTQSNNLQKCSQGFSYLTIGLLLNINDDEIEQSLTDTEYLNIKADPSKKGKDRGVDAVYIDYSSTPACIHIFNFKYTESFEKTKSNFPSGEIDKLISFISDLMSESESLSNGINSVLADKVQEINELYKEHPIVDIKIHLCSNLYHGLVSDERDRFINALSRYSKVQFIEHNLKEYVSIISNTNKEVINAKIRLIDKNFFEKADGDINALIANIDATEVLKAVSKKSDIRLSSEPVSYDELISNGVHDDAFDDNVRIYLKQKTKINKNIKNTAKSENSHRFFYFNNGITITCKSFEYTKSIRAPLVQLHDLQIVNGCQTIHALLDALSESPEHFDNVDLLCRIYKTENESLSNEIAEYTNSQNPVKSRDIRSNDFVQKYLEQSLLLKGYFYERKRNQYYNKPIAYRIDAEKAGQLLMSLYNGIPAEAKTDKKVIFSEKYDIIFDESITDDDIIIAFEIYKHIMMKAKAARESKETSVLGSVSSFINHASYYLLYAIGECAKKRGVELKVENINTLNCLYDDAFNILIKAAESEKEKKQSYDHRSFFISARPRFYLEEALR